MKRVLVTGAGSGIGASTALHLDGLGMRVFAGVLDEQEAAAALSGASDRLCRVVLDVADGGSVARAVGQVGEQLDGAGLDGLVNNAGIGVVGPLEILPLQDLREQLDVNVLGQVAVTQAALPLLRTATGRIVFVGSVGGLLATQFAGAYHASKFAIEAIADVWRQELDPEGIAVVLVEPSAISTPIWDKAVRRLDDLLGAPAPALPRYRERLEAFRESLRSADEHGKSPEDVAAVIEKALTDKRPDTRYVVGAAGRLASAVKPLVPDRLADKIAERTAKPDQD